MKTAFTGTRKGMTPAQQESVRLAIRHYEITRGYCGAAKGSDRQFYDLLGPKIPCELFPCKEEQHAWAIATCYGGKDVIHPIDFNPIRRNHKMVDIAKFVIATPAGRIPQPRGSGTWATMRYSGKIGINCLIIWPDGNSQFGVYL